MRLIEIIKSIIKSFTTGNSNTSSYNSQIKKLNYKCDKVTEGLKNSTNSDKRYRIRNVLKSKDEIIELLRKDPDRLIKQKIALQTLDLVIVYSNILENYYIRLKDIDRLDIKKIQERINNNIEKSNSSTNIDQINQLKELGEIDKELLDNIIEEKSKLEVINNKLEFIESTISLFTQQMLSDIDGELQTQTIQDTVNEAIALSNTISKINKQRI